MLQLLQYNTPPPTTEPYATSIHIEIDIAMSAPTSRCLAVRHLAFRPRNAHHAQRRLASSSDTPAKSNPFLNKFTQENPGALKPNSGNPQAQARPAPGDLPASSIFEDERRIAEQRAGADTSGSASGSKPKPTRDPERMQRILDPDPNARERWERKKVIQLVKRGGRLNRAEFIKRTEREHLVKSHNLKTSVKKLGMLARQIQGKTLDEAITQMRFSGKKVAIEVLKQLEHARDEAVVTRGMGLGKVNDADADAAAEASDEGAEEADAAVADVVTKMETLQIQLKDRTRHKVTDLSDIYIEQAWVGRGPFGKLPDFRARGRTFIMRTPWTSFTVLLKEEATRVREWREREDRKRKEMLRKVWVQLPDRPVTTQRQFYTF